MRRNPAQTHPQRHPDLGNSQVTAITPYRGLHLTGPTINRLPDVVLGDGILAYMGGFMVAYAA